MTCMLVVVKIKWNLRFNRKVSYLHLERINCIGTFFISISKKKFRPRNFDLNILH
jgi:hypothetical protein